MDEKSFFNTSFCFTSRWDYKHYNEGTSQKIVNLSITNKTLLKCDVVDGSVVNGLRQPILYSVVLDKLPGYKVFCELERNHYKKKSVLNTITFYLEDDDNEEVNFNGETLTSTLQMLKILTIKWAFKILKLIVFAMEEDIDLLRKTYMVI